MAKGVSPGHGRGRIETSPGGILRGLFEALTGRGSHPDWIVAWDPKEGRILVRDLGDPERPTYELTATRLPDAERPAVSDLIV